MLYMRGYNPDEENALQNFVEKQKAIITERPYLFIEDSLTIRNADTKSEHNYKIKVASTPASKSVGLIGTDGLEENTGFLYFLGISPYVNSDERDFINKITNEDTSFPVDIIFIDEYGSIFRIIQNVPAYDNHQYYYFSRTAAILILKSGETEKNNINLNSWTKNTNWFTRTHLLHEPDKIDSFENQKSFLENYGKVCKTGNVKLIEKNLSDDFSTISFLSGKSRHSKQEYLESTKNAKIVDIQYLMVYEHITKRPILLFGFLNIGLFAACVATENADGKICHLETTHPQKFNYGYTNYKDFKVFIETTKLHRFLNTKSTDHSEDDGNKKDG